MCNENEIQDGPYTVRQLIEALQKCKNQDAPVNVYLLDSTDSCDYVATGRYPVTFVDDNFQNHCMVDLNVSAEWLGLRTHERRKEQDACTENN